MFLGRCGVEGEDDMWGEEDSMGPDAGVVGVVGAEREGDPARLEGDKMIGIRRGDTWATGGEMESVEVVEEKAGMWLGLVGCMEKLVAGGVDPHRD